MYTDQDRGNQKEYARYLAGMDSVVVEKVASASAYFTEKRGHAIVDVGMASGMSSYILALLFPNTTVIGVDINPKMVEIAQQKYSLPNLQFIIDDGEKLESLENQKINGFFNCSSIHHITSFNNYDPQKAYLTLRRQAELLCEGGILVVRDFAKPEEKEIFIEFPNNKQGYIDATNLIRFSETARSLSFKNEIGFPLYKLDKAEPRLKFQLQLSDAFEFIRRKDYIEDWNVELQEEYGYYSQNDFENVFSELGLRTVVSYPVYNSWIINNRYKNKFTLSDLSGEKIGIPPTNYIIAGEKTKGRGTKLKSIRSLPIMENSFIKIQSYINNKNNKIYELAERPGKVIDLIPYYYAENGNLKILARHGYPRPVITYATIPIDGKKYSGYVTEGIAAMIRNKSNKTFIKEILKERIGIKEDKILLIEQALTFYTSPGGINEKVECAYIEIKAPDNKIIEPLGNYSGFSDSGIIHEFDALQLLKSAQVGALPEARLELHIYGLLKKKSINPGKWLNEYVELPEINHLNTIKLKEISLEEKNVFSEIDRNLTFLAHKRTKYFEYGVDDSAAILEHTEPIPFSSNTAVTLPVFKHKSHIYIGIEKRHLPVPQLKEGNSMLLAAPAYRLTKSIKNLSQLEHFLLNKEFFGTRILTTTKLGEKYMPCMGITPEQVYPYIVKIEKASDQLLWVSLDDLLDNSLKLRDGHLLICINRLKHIFTEEI